LWPVSPPSQYLDGASAKRAGRRIANSFTHAGRARGFAPAPAPVLWSVVAGEVLATAIIFRRWEPEEGEDEEEWEEAWSLLPMRLQRVANTLQDTVERALRILVRRVGCYLHVRIVSKMFPQEVHPRTPTEAPTGRSGEASASGAERTGGGETFRRQKSSDATSEKSASDSVSQRQSERKVVRKEKRKGGAKVLK